MNAPPPSFPTTWPQQLRVGVVEDDPQSRETLLEVVRAEPDLSLVLVASSRCEALALLPLHAMDVLVCDLGLPDGSGLDVIRATRAQWPACSILVSTLFGDDAHVLRSIEAGAMGYLLKDGAFDEMAQEIRNIHAGGSPISPMVARKILARAASVPLPTEPALHSPNATGATVALSAREQQVLKLVSKGFSTDEVAQALGVSRTTVRTFVRRIYAKLEVNNRAEAIHEAHRKGLLAN
ncbi:MAG: response regulator [Acidovorax sp.]|uniref:response regulator n=1 Tax=Acidovorax sp. TaxID=1872122 RepID=UPI0039189CCC